MIEPGSIGFSERSEAEDIATVCESNRVGVPLSVCICATNLSSGGPPYSTGLYPTFEYLTSKTT